MVEFARTRKAVSPAGVTLSCVVPALNEAENLKVLLPQLASQLDGLVAAYEIVVVDDGSTDATPEVLARLTAESDAFVYLQLSRNFGKEAALTAGIEAARGDVIVCMDADMQHPPSLIPVMLERWHQGVDMVYAVRSDRQDETFFKRAGTRLFYQLLRTSRGLTVPRDAGDFRLMDRCVVDALLELPERDRFMKGLFAWVGFESEPIYYDPPERLHGQSRFKPLSLFRLAVDGLTAFTTWPLRLMSVAGMFLSMASFTYGLIIVISHFLWGDPVQGWTTLITVILFFAGVQLIAVGVLGEYIGRIFSEVKQRPVYLLRRRRGAGLGGGRRDNRWQEIPARVLAGQGSSGAPDMAGSADGTDGPRAASAVDVH
jgi:Glycosyltransferases involved in cell wall biogenesis